MCGIVTSAVLCRRWLHLLLLAADGGGHSLCLEGLVREVLDRVSQGTHSRRRAADPTHRQSDGQQRIRRKMPQHQDPHSNRHDEEAQEGGPVHNRLRVFRYASVIRPSAPSQTRPKEEKEAVAISVRSTFDCASESTPLKLDSHLLDNGPYQGGDLNRKCALTLSIVSVVFNLVVGGTGFVFAFQRNSASIYAFAAECLLDMLSSIIVIWQYLTPHYSFARERIACMLLGLFFIISAIAIISKAMEDLIVRESPTWVILVMDNVAGAAACFALALVKFVLARRMGSLSLVLDGINSLISAFCAVAIIVSDLVYDSNPEIWYMDAVLSTVAALVMLLVGA
ncbi:hypothetical protein HPB47_002035, partial [Ixodes persulcatus]